MNLPNAVVRPAVSSDAGIIVEMIRALAGYEGSQRGMRRTGGAASRAPVRPHAIGRSPHCGGVGHALLTYVAQLVADRGCGRLEWSVLNPPNSTGELLGTARTALLLSSGTVRVIGLCRPAAEESGEPVDGGSIVVD